MNNIIFLFSTIGFILCFLLVLLTFTVNIKKLFRYKLAPVKTVRAKVVDKYKPRVVSKYPVSFGQKNYIVVFETKDKKLSFEVSEFSYNSYKLGEKGTLKYKDTKIISFK